MTIPTRFVDKEKRKIRKGCIKGSLIALGVYVAARNLGNIPQIENLLESGVRADWWLPQLSATVSLACGLSVLPYRGLEHKEKKRKLGRTLLGVSASALGLYCLTKAAGLDDIFSFSSRDYSFLVGQSREWAYNFLENALWHIDPLVQALPTVSASISGLCLPLGLEERYFGKFAFSKIAKRGYEKVKSLF